MMDSGMEVLLVEDDPNDVRLTMRELNRERPDTRVEVVRDGEEALDFLFCRGAYADRSLQRPPRLVLLDLKLPKVNGLQVLREIKSCRETRAIPVVALTSSREEKDRADSYKFGVNSYIQKPVDFDQFRQTIKTLALYWLGFNQPPPEKVFAAD
jgi:two-component system, response regulator